MWIGVACGCGNVSGVEIHSPRGALSVEHSAWSTRSTHQPGEGVRGRLGAPDDSPVERGLAAVSVVDVHPLQAGKVILLSDLQS